MLEGMAMLRLEDVSRTNPYGYLAEARQLRRESSPIAEVTRSLGVSEATYYHWRKKYGQMAVAEIRRLRQLEEENRTLKQLVADLTLDNVILQEVLAKKA